MDRIGTGKKLAFALSLTLTMWLFAEAAATLFFRGDVAAWESPPVAVDEHAPTMPGNPYLLYEYRPGVHMERHVTVTINSMGLRGPEPVIPKPQGVRRFITTGDSSVFGFGVQDDEVFSAVAGQALGDSVEDISAAVPGYSSYQSINMLRLRALKTEPDLLVIANIWSDNNFDSFVDKEVLAAYAGFEESARGKVVRLMSHSAVFRVLDYRMRIAPAAQAVQRVGWMQSGRAQDGRRRVAINDYAANLGTLAGIAESAGADVVFMVLANNEDLSLEANAGKAWDPYRTVMRETAARIGAPVIDVPALFIESGLDKETLFLDEMHPTAAGHKIMGDALAAVLKDAAFDKGGTVMAAGSPGPVPVYEDPYVSGGTAQADGGPPGGQHAPGQDNPNGTAAPPQPGGGQVSGPSVGGSVRFSGYEAGTIQIEAFPASQVGGNPTVLSTTRLSGPGSFSLAVRDAESVVLRAYMDADQDGPDADDERFDLTAHIIEVGAEGSDALLVDLDAVSVTPGAAQD